MRILVVLPNWLGDTVMATSAIELLASHYRDVKFTFVGAFASIEAMKYHPLCEKIVILDKKAPSRFLATYKLARELGKFDLAITFRKQLHSSLLLRFTGTVLTIAREAWHSKFLLSHTPNIPKYTKHLAEQYAQLAMTNVDDYSGITPPSKLYIEPKKFDKPTLGINGGAAFGSAKQWYPERFAQVAASYSNIYDIIILGAPNEIEIANKIEEELISLGIKNYTNLAGKTSIKELCANIGGCSLMLTNDSGPMHIAAAYQIPTVAIIGPTEYKQTYPWMNEKGKIVRHDLECSPCVKRECPLKHHDCMKGITSLEVIQAVKELNL